MDLLKYGAGAVLLAALAGSLFVRDQQPMTVATMPMPPICGDVVDNHEAGSTQTHIDMMAAIVDQPHRALLQTMEPMHTDMMRGMTAPDFDVAFVCSMLPHHQGAVEMAQVALDHGSDPWVKMVAQEIIAAQQTEIAEMRQWLARRSAALASAP
jgi:uncharacterized protein (DUF305 family)